MSRAPAGERPAELVGSVGAVLLAAALVVSLPCFFSEPLRRNLGGVGPALHWWQWITPAFVHGWPGFPGPVHLALNLALLLTAWKTAEGMLGPWRSAVLAAAGLAALAATRALSGIEMNGLSVVLWACTPTLLVIWRNEAAREELRSRAGGALLVMWGAIGFAMAVLPYLAGWRGNPLQAFLLGNAYHLAGTAAGIPVAVLWRRRIGARSERSLPRRSPLGPGDRRALAAGWGLVASLTLLVLWLLGMG